MMPAANLIDVEGYTPGGVRDRTIRPNSMLLVRVREDSGTQLWNQPVPFLLAEALQTMNKSLKDGKVLVAWLVPGQAPRSDYRRGRRVDVTDIFGPWRPWARLNPREATRCTLPHPLIDVSTVLEANFDLTEENTIPYPIFDRLRAIHGVDTTGLNLSSTQRGNLYRAYALQRGMPQ